MLPKDTVERRRELADKLMLAKKTPGLTMAERRDICYLLTGEQQTASKRGPKKQNDRDGVTALVNAIQRLDSGADNLELARTAGSERGKQKLLQRGREYIVQSKSEEIYKLTEDQYLLQKLQLQCTPPGNGLIYNEIYREKIELFREIESILKDNQKSEALCSELIRLMNIHKK